MKLHSPDNSVLLDVTSFERRGNELWISGKIMGAMPMRAVLRPDEARAALRALGLRTLLFLLSLPFRRVVVPPRPSPPRGRVPGGPSP